MEHETSVPHDVCNWHQLNPNGELQWREIKSAIHPISRRRRKRVKNTLLFPLLVLLILLARSPVLYNAIHMKKLSGQSTIESVLPLLCRHNILSRRIKISPANCSHTVTVCLLVLQVYVSPLSTSTPLVAFDGLTMGK